MSRRNTFPSLSSSRQMMMAWKVSGLSHSPAIIASRPASMRLAMAISPSRERSSTEPISRRYIRTGSSVRSDGSLASDLAGTFCWTSTSSPLSLSLLLGLLALFLSLLARLLGLDDVDPHLAEHREDVLDLLGIDLFRQRVDLVMGDVAALLGAADQRLDGRVDRSSSGLSGGVSGPSFSSISSFCGVILVLLAMNLRYPALSPRRTLGGYAAYNKLRNSSISEQGPTVEATSQAACSALRNWSQLGKSAPIFIHMGTDRAHRQSWPRKSEQDNRWRFPPDGPS